MKKGETGSVAICADPDGQREICDDVPRRECSYRETGEEEICPFRRKSRPPTPHGRASR
jgi:hypothetical protein